ncbi:hypothetical protein MnTg02_01699 [bacterium MnTg02]|nr:hypothetical protein MnTg02_01699 [bacterium MnTg02]
MALSLINALCTSTHFIIPAVFDRLGVQTIPFFLKKFKQLQAALFPHSKLLGVIANRTRGSKLTPSEMEVMQRIKQQGTDAWGEMIDTFDCQSIPNHVAISASEGPAYMDSPEIRQIFDEVGTAFLAKFGVPPPAV